MSTFEKPHKIWYIAHVFFWIISGVICYFVWKDRNKQSAQKHLIHSLWIGAIGYIATIPIIIILSL